LNGLDRFTVPAGVIVVKILPIPFLMVIDDLRKLIHFELLVLGGMGIVKGPLLDGDVPTDKTD
jgi:hypothetical protein